MLIYLSMLYLYVVYLLINKISTIKDNDISIYYQHCHHIGYNKVVVMMREF